jgi:carboxyl-terminal processing protease
MLDNIAYLQVNTFGDMSVMEDFDKYLPELRKAKGVIFDIRQNGGGSSEVGAQMLKYFTDDKVLTGSVWQTRDNQAAFRAWGKFYNDRSPDSLSEFEKKAVSVYRGSYWFQGDTMRFENDVQGEKIKTPLVILIGDNTASAAEDFLIMVSGLKNKPLTIGQPTYGSTGQPLMFDMPGGGYARVCTKKDTYPDGKEFVGYGIQPDVVVERNVKEIINGEDLTLQVALREIKKKIN